MAALKPLRAGSLLLALSLLVLACRIESSPGVGDGSDGARAPEFSLADHRGRPVVVDFWATWCPPCVQQIPVLNAFQAAHYGEVTVLGIAVDSRGIEAVAPFATEHGIQYPVLIGDESLAQEYGAFGFPSLYVIAPDGSIATNHVGVITEEELEEALVAAAASSGPETH